MAESKKLWGALKTNTTAIFIGNHNCGKSAIINELLQGTYLPVHENPCTSRIVRIRYSEKNVAQLVSPEGRVLQTSVKEFRKKVPKTFVVLADDDKEEKKLRTVVEVGLKHELLRSGIELIDCPGKIETPALDKVVDEFLEKGTVPLVVYVIDGDIHLQQTDLKTISFLQEKLPPESFMFVCNKNDTTKGMEGFDAEIVEAPNKKRAVFAQLKSSRLLPEDANINSCQAFHGISARNVRKARLRWRQDEFTNLFSRFKVCFRAALSDGVKRMKSISSKTLTGCFEEASGDRMTDPKFLMSDSKKLGSALKTHSTAIFVGNPNCGKSSLLNEILQATYLPVHENPCTSRIVRIRYSEKNVAQLVSPDGRVLQTSVREFKKKIPRDFVILDDEDIEGKERLEAVVEVGLKHELLKSGLELIDCPGKNETPALDRIVDEVSEKGTPPLVVYVIDGDMQLQQTDLKRTIFYLEEKLPRVSFMFVCNKIDMAKGLEEFDADLDIDSENAYSKTGEALNKKDAVFAWLKSCRLLPEDAVIDSCQAFHGVSAKNIRKARIEGIEDESTKKFSRFKECFRAVLLDGIKRVKLTGGKTSNSCLEEALREHRIFISRLEALHRETLIMLTKFQAKLGIGDDKMEISVPTAELEEVESALKKTPAVIFIGNHNCGKSSLLNELLQGTYVPVHENPCTSRIVRIKYSEKNVASLISPNGCVLVPNKGFKKGLPQNFVVLCDEDKDDKEKLGAVVEVGLNHELLKSGFELIDCPGKNETLAIDEVIDEFLEKGTTPLVVYVIDGDMQLRSSDHETITFLREKLSDVSLMFVCNKIDTTKKAKAFDDQDSYSERDSQDAAAPQASDKKEAVFAQLMRLYLLPEDASIDSCEVFHGLSAKNTRKARIQQREDEYSRSFFRFQECFHQILANAVKRHVRLAIDGIIFVLNQLILATQAGRDDLSKSDFLKEGVAVAMQTGEIVANLLRDKVVKDLVSEETIDDLLIKVKRETLEDVECYQERSSHVLPDESVEHLVSRLLESQMSEAELRAAISFISGMASTIGCKFSAIMLRVLEKSLKYLIARLSKDLQLTIEQLELPVLRRALCRAYGIDLGKAKGSAIGAAEIARKCLIISSEMVQAIKVAACGVIRSETALVFVQQLDPDVLVSSLLRAGSLVMTNNWKKEVVNSLLSGFNPRQISSAINEACKTKVSKMGDHFASALKTLESRLEVVRVTLVNCTILKEMQVLFVPQLKQLAVKALAFRNKMELGAVQLGSLVASDKGVTVHSCLSPLWGESRLVRVVKKGDVGEEVWCKLAEDIYRTKEVLDKQITPSPFLLRLYGWLMPAPDVLHIITETTKKDLLTALQQGMTLENRLNIARQVSVGLKSVHDAGDACGDLNPQRILISGSETAKIDLVKLADPLQETRLGVPFHLALHLCEDEEKFRVSSDIYAFGMLLWILGDGTGTARPKAYDDYKTAAQMKIAVQQGIFPERPQGSSDACWELMKSCWKNCSEIKMDLVVEKLKNV